MISERWAATTKRTIGNLRPSRAYPRSISVSIARSFSLGCAPGPTKDSPNGCAGSIRCACSTRCFRMPIRSCGRYFRVSNTCADNRQPVARDNAFWQAQEWIADWTETSLDAYRDMRDHMSEALFHAIYGSPILQALVGSRHPMIVRRRKPGRDPAHLALVDAAD